jgi:small GTP-binding protein
MSVGKSSIIKRFISNEFNDKYICTIGTELFNKSLLIGDNKLVNLYIWDTCGQEKFRTVTRQYYRNTHAILLTFDLTNKKSFDDLNSWFQEAVNYVDDNNCLFFVLGNKCDATEKIEVENDEIKEFVRKNPKIKKYFEVSAFDGHNIDLSFDKISQHLVMKFGGEEINKNMDEYKKKLQFEISTNEKNEKKGGCC